MTQRSLSRDPEQESQALSKIDGFSAGEQESAGIRKSTKIYTHMYKSITSDHQQRAAPGRVSYTIRSATGR